MTPTRCNRDSAKRNGMGNYNVNSGGGYCKLLEHCVCRRLSTKQQLPFREAETPKEFTKKYLIYLKLLYLQSDKS